MYEKLIFTTKDDKKILKEIADEDAERMDQGKP
jgi:hypothetical protein